jgi:hypothetical protein
MPFDLFTPKNFLLAVLGFVPETIFVIDEEELLNSYLL